jgi:hypothetical protein
MKEAHKVPEKCKMFTVPDEQKKCKKCAALYIKK